MRLSINAVEREQALLALKLGDKQCDAARKQLERLHIEPLQVMVLQGQFEELRKALNHKAQRVYEWHFEQRRALAIALRIYRDSLQKLAASEIDLLRKENDATQEEIGDVTDFLARLAGQETLFDDRAEATEKVVRTAAETHVADAGPAQAQLDLGEERPAELEELITEREKDSFDWTPQDHRTWLADVAGAMERGPSRYKSFDFTTTVQYVLPSVAQLWGSTEGHGFDGTRAGGFLLQEMIHDEVNAVALASWIRGQLRDAPDGLLGAAAAKEQDPPPPKLSREQVDEIRRSVGKDCADFSEEEQRVLAEHDPVNPIDVVCPHCFAKAGHPCLTAGDKVVGSEPHLARMTAAGIVSSDRKLTQIASALYLDAAALQVFGRVNDEIRTAVKKRRTIDMNAKWVVQLQSLSAAPAAAEARA